VYGIKRPLILRRAGDGYHLVGIGVLGLGEGLSFPKQDFVQTNIEKGILKRPLIL
jgi:hypothetical protein